MCGTAAQSRTGASFVLEGFAVPTHEALPRFTRPPHSRTSPRLPSGRHAFVDALRAGPVPRRPARSERVRRILSSNSTEPARHLVVKCGVACELLPSRQTGPTRLVHSPSESGTGTGRRSCSCRRPASRRRRGPGAQVSPVGTDQAADVSRSGLRVRSAGPVMVRHPGQTLRPAWAVRDWDVGSLATWPAPGGARSHRTRTYDRSSVAVRYPGG